MKSERLGRAVEQIQDFSANTRYRINLKKREFNVRAKENMLLESDINYPGDFDEYVKELFNEGEEESYTVGMRICAMGFEELSSPSEVPYSKKKHAKYKIQQGPEESRIHKDH